MKTTTVSVVVVLAVMLVLFIGIAIIMPRGDILQKGMSACESITAPPHEATALERKVNELKLAAGNDYMCSITFWVLEIPGAYPEVGISCWAGRCDIEVDPDFLAAHDDNEVKGIFAHELGHVATGHAFITGRGHSIYDQLEADVFAIELLERLGISPETQLARRKTAFAYRRRLKRRDFMSLVDREQYEIGLWLLVKTWKARKYL